MKLEFKKDPENNEEVKIKKIDFIRNTINKLKMKRQSKHKLVAYKKIQKIKALADKKEASIIAPLLNALKSRKPELAVASYQILQKIKFSEAVEPLLAALKSKNPLVVDVAIEVLGNIGDAKAIPYLIDTSITENLIDGKNNTQEYPHLEETLKKLSQNMIIEDNYSLCGKCFHRYERYYEECKKYGDFNYYTCRNCGSDAYQIPGAKRIILYIDSTLKEPFTRKSHSIYVNWLQLKKPFDFDEVEIKSASDKELEELVMILRNDKDNKRRKDLNLFKPLVIPTHFKPSQAKLNLLKSTFDVQIYGQ
jgi:hypothetical protein